MWWRDGKREKKKKLTVFGLGGVPGHWQITEMSPSVFEVSGCVMSGCIDVRVHGCRGVEMSGCCILGHGSCLACASDACGSQMKFESSPANQLEVVCVCFLIRN